MKPGLPNPWWDNLEKVFGYRPTSKNERALWGQFCKRCEDNQIPPGEVIIRAVRYLQTWPNVSLTPTALFKWFDYLGGTAVELKGSQKRAISRKQETRAALEEFLNE